MRDLNATKSQLLANTLYQRCKEGRSLNVNFEVPKVGYMVSVLDGPVYNKAPDVDTLEVAAFIREQLPRWKNCEFFGVWTDSETGKIQFAMSLCIEDKEKAITIGRVNEQIAIYDVVNGCEIRL